jgi:hypothetical protein
MQCGLLNSTDVSKELVTSIFSVEKQVKQEADRKHSWHKLLLLWILQVASDLMWCTKLYETSNDASTPAPEKGSRGAK